MKVLISGSKGFIGSNLVARLNELQIDYISYDKGDDINEIESEIQDTNFIFHLAGINRPENDDHYSENQEITDEICQFLTERKLKIPILFSSSIQAVRDNPYAKSKKQSEDRLKAFQSKSNCPVMIYRLTNVFGKWSKPNYNSVVATFCHNVANEIPLIINDKNATISLVYIDDVIDEFIKRLDTENPNECSYFEIDSAYDISIGELAKKISSYSDISKNITVPRTGKGFDRALYATYLSYLQPKSFSYNLKSYDDDRGRFVEMLKTIDSGQISFFTANPGVMRGDHYHHTKNEQFFVIQGTALFKFKNIRTNDYFEKVVDSGNPEIIQTVPGWNHDITNIGENELIVMLWANEVFDSENPDTIKLS